MQKIFQNKSIAQKIIIAIIFVILFNYTCPMIVLATDDDNSTVFQILAWLVIKITDVVQWIIDWCLTGDGSDIILSGDIEFVRFR